MEWGNLRQISVWSIMLITLLSCTQQDVHFASSPKTQSFSQAIKYNNKVDFLWVIDNSGSMQQHQTKLSNQIDGLADSLLTANIDFHFGVITTDVFNNYGQLQGSPAFLTQATPDFKNLLKQRFLVGENGTNLEQGLEAIYKALIPPNVKYANMNFLREDAILVVVILTDEEDQSPQNADYYNSFLDQLKPVFPDGARGWTLHFIGVDAMNTLCTTINDFSSVGMKYIDLAQRSGGIVGSICESDLRQTLENISSRIIEILTDYRLDYAPIVDTIVVYVNGKLVNKSEVDGWSYFPDTLTIRFHGLAIPPADAQIVVSFEKAPVN